MNNDIIGKEVVFYENNTWNHIIKEINLYTYTIEYGIKSGFSDKEQAEQSYFFFNEKFQKDIERIKRLTNIQYTFTEYLDFWMKNLYLPYSDSSAKVGYSWTIYQIILPNPDKPEKLFLFSTPCVILKKKGVFICYSLINTLIKFMASLPVMTA